MRQYISIHAGIPTRTIQTDLCGPFLALLRHPGTDWAREQTALLADWRLCAEPDPLSKRLRIAVQCRRAAAGDLAARAEFERAVQGTRDGAAKLRDARWESMRGATRAAGLQPGRGRHDRPRRSALANALLDEAAALPKGFAGGQAPASFTLAEANSIVRPANFVARDAALDQSRSSAHNVQDPGSARAPRARRCHARAVVATHSRVPRRSSTHSFRTVLRQFAPLHHVARSFPERPKTDERIATAR